MSPGAVSGLLHSGDENAAFLGNAGQLVCGVADEYQGLPALPPSCVFVGGTMLGRKAVAGCKASAKGLIGADKYGQESPGPVAPPCIKACRGSWIPNSVLGCESVPHIRLSDVNEISELGCGTYGRVMRSHVSGGKLHASVAIKLASPGREKDITQEAHILSHLDHDRIVPLYSVAPALHDPTVASALVTELCEGGSLGDWLVLRRKRASASGTSSLLPFTQRLNIAHQILSGLAHAHARGYAHLDIKPGNILLKNGHPEVFADSMLCDFGLAQPINGELMPGQYRGTWPYMPPEMVRQSRTAAHPALDVWSFGVLLWDLVSFTGPGSGLSGDQIKHALREGLLYTGGGAGLPCEPEWRALIGRCLQYAPERRASVPELLAAVSAARALAAHREAASRRVARLFGRGAGVVRDEAAGSPRVQACWEGSSPQRTPSPAVVALPESLGLYVCATESPAADRSASPVDAPAVPLKLADRALQLKLPESLGLYGVQKAGAVAAGKVEGGMGRGVGGELCCGSGECSRSISGSDGQENDRHGHLNLPRSGELWG